MYLLCETVSGESCRVLSRFEGRRNIRDCQHCPLSSTGLDEGSRSRSGIKIKDQDQGLKSNQVLTLFGNILFENASVLPGSSHTETSQLIFLTFQSSFLNLCIALVSPSRAAHQLPQPRLSAGFVRLAVAASD